ncbi:MAG TPA: hypothetical protein VJ246_00410 [Patescibacteria group bacterium]|nr:hypothetical protein [Patescibacteria group bacterium]
MIKSSTTSSDFIMYVRVAILGAVFAVASYYYITWLKIPNPLNKALADTSIYLIGLSMVMASVCYFWNLFDRFIVYRKHLGIVGFLVGIAHIYLSYGFLKTLFLLETWQKGAVWPQLTGLLAAAIFLVMTLISPAAVAAKIGGPLWRIILRFGHVAVILIWLHVYLLKFARIQQWYAGGMKTPPSSSVLVLIFMTIVIVLRVALWIALARKKATRIQ